jgi:hypothetical protein
MKHTLQFLSSLLYLEMLIIPLSCLGSVTVIVSLLLVIALRIIFKYKAQNGVISGQFRRRLSSEQSTQYAYVDVCGKVSSANLTSNCGYVCVGRPLSDKEESAYAIPDLIDSSTVQDDTIRYAETNN